MTKTHYKEKKLPIVNKKGEGGKYDFEFTSIDLV